MTAIKVYALDGKVTGEAELPANLFAADVRKSLIHEAVRAEEAAQRQGTVQTKTRADVAGGGKKPWKQKGTGRARHGSIRSPIWRKGGTVFGPHPRDYSLSLNRKQRRLALAGALTARAGEERVIGLDASKLAAPSTKDVAKFLRGFEGISKPLVLHTAEEAVLAKSVRNIRKALHRNVQNISVRSVMLADLVIVTPAALAAMKTIFSEKRS